MKQLVFETETEKRFLGDFEEGKDAPFLQLTKALLDFDQGGFYDTDFREGIIKDELKEVKKEYRDEYSTREIIDELTKALNDGYYFFIYEGVHGTYNFYRKDDEEIFVETPSHSNFKLHVQ